MASLQARHSRSCEIGKPWTPAAALDGCTCPRGPLFHVVVRDGTAAHKQPVGRNRRNAERALTRAQGQQDEGTFDPVKRIRFDAWAELWLASLETKRNTVRSYTSTIALAERAFGSKLVRGIGPDDVKRLLVTMREDGLSDSTRAKHLRVLGACLQSALIAGYTGRNPVRMIPRSEKPKPAKKESAYFENAELPLIFGRLDAGVYRSLCLVALKTGMRLGELLALTWGDVSLLDGVIRVRRTYTDGFLDAPKTHDPRDVDLSPEVVELLGGWWRELGEPGDDRLVFPGPTKSGYLDSGAVLDELYAAMQNNDVARFGPSGEKPSFHSFRHTFAKVALESGRSITWLQRQLGHKSITITIDRYGHWERAARRVEAEALVGAFSV
jgi:integrase